MSNLISLKPICKRKLKSGEYIVLSEHSDPIVVDAEIVAILELETFNCDNYHSEFIEILDESGFFEPTEGLDYFKERTTKKWRIARKGLLLIGNISLISIIVSIFFIGIPTGDKLISKEMAIESNLGFIFGFSIVTTGIHELMHIIFANSWKKIKIGVKVTITKATVTVAMSHIWVWSFLSRFAAISAGLIFDLCLLAVLSYAQFFYDSKFLPIASAVLWIRILWQLQFQKRNDGQFLVSTSIDEPTAEFNLVTENHIVKKITILGYFISLLLIVFWFLPFIYQLVLK
ncbi:hypothetical protein [Carnobacterium maltaromaticum]|uniref:hypothetical protein n=1 Tax=Carnobacterium maltaromaticum TaxID=2751 RepID=UPI001072C260|nr:hypothetical protein [Carnobacterium maltaromaticum]TFJ76082.1 hypothetical protein CKN94_04400 [Carnobacterium maltaromaticum]TFJ79023.1 hypothetical protein CKN97_04395 [Carnobacterium maltaromaticum]